jgi:inner membrane protein
MKTEFSNKLAWSNSLTFKSAIISIIALLLLIPLGMIKSVISERERTAQEVENNISDQFGNDQTLVGPILNIPVEKLITDKDGLVTSERSWLHIMPEMLDIKANLEPEIRYRGIYKTAVYNSDSQISGHFSIPINDEDVDGNIEWDKACVTFGISDNRGIRGDVEVLWNHKHMTTQSGMITKNIAKTGFSVRTPLSKENRNEIIPFEIKLALSGSKSFSVLPIGQTSNIQIASTWNDPSFSGSLLPQERSVTEKGFTANWKLTHLNRNFPQYWQGQQFDVWEHQLGVDLFLPVNHYQKSYRSAKYGLLFIALSMLVFLFMELTKNKKVHLFQYLLVGLALVLFFSVLTALSEHLGFNIAFLIASIVNVAMIGYFAYGLLKDKTLTTWVVALLLIMYSFLFVLLQLNDYAFLAGNIGLLIALAFIMKASLKIRNSQ